MGAALDMSPPLTLEEFLEWDLRQDGRFEWDGVQPLAMVGGSLGHNVIASRLATAIDRHLAGGPCTVFRADAPVLTEHGSRVRYPDVVVSCSPFRRGDRFVPNPVLIVEVLSETTAAIDRGVKRAEYAALPSLARYVMLAQDAPIALVCDRDGDFVERQEREAIALPEFGLTLPLADLYAGLVD